MREHQPDNEGQAEPPAAKPAPRNPLQVVVAAASAAVGIGLSRYAGMAVWIPMTAAFVVGALVYFAQNRKPTPMLLAIAVQGGHACWMALGALVSGRWDMVGIDLFILAVGLLWLLLRPNLGAVLLLSLYQVIVGALNVLQISAVPVATDMHRALVVHITLRGAAILFMWSAWVQMQKAAAKEAAGRRALAAACALPAAAAKEPGVTAGEEPVIIEEMGEGKNAAPRFTRDACDGNAVKAERLWLLRLLAWIGAVLALSSWVAGMKFCNAYSEGAASWSWLWPTVLCGLGALVCGIVVECAKHAPLPVSVSPFSRGGLAGAIAAAIYVGVVVLYVDRIPQPLKPPRDRYAEKSKAWEREKTEHSDWGRTEHSDWGKTERFAMPERKPEEEPPAPPKPTPPENVMASAPVKPDLSELKINVVWGRSPLDTNPATGGRRPPQPFVPPRIDLNPAVKAPPRPPQPAVPPRDPSQPTTGPRPQDVVVPSVVSQRLMPRAPKNMSRSVLPQTVDESLQQWREEVDGFQITSFGKSGSALSLPLWSRDGQRLYAIQSPASLVEIDAWNWRLLRRLGLAPSPKAAELCWSKVGLVVAYRCREGTSLTIVDPDTLRVVKDVTLANATRFAVSPVSSRAYVVFSGEREYGAIDLEDESLVWKSPARTLFDPSLPPEKGVHGGVAALAVSGDEQHLFCVGRQGLNRLLIGPTGCAFEERTDGDGIALEVSMDSSDIVRHAVNPPRGATAKQTTTSYVYPVHNLANPSHALNFSGRALPVAVDPVAGHLYMQDPTGLAVLHRSGRVIGKLSSEAMKKLAERTDTRRHSVSRLLPSPRGNAVLLMCNGEGRYIEIPTDEGN